MSTSTSPSPAGMSSTDPNEHRSVTSFLLSHGLDVRRENVRVVAGFALLLVAGVVALNMTLWRNASQRIEANAWRRLESAADVQRNDVDQTLGVLRREALSVLGSPQVVGAVLSWSREKPSATALAELTHRAEQFEFDNLAVLDERGNDAWAEVRSRVQLVPIVTVPTGASLEGDLRGNSRWLRRAATRPTTVRR